MRKPGPLKLAIVLTTIAVALFLVAVAIRNREAHAAGRFKLERRPAELSNRLFFGNTLSGISIWLCFSPMLSERVFTLGTGPVITTQTRNSLVGRFNTDCFGSGLSIFRTREVLLLCWR
jgi:hypothetical protein